MRDFIDLLEEYKKLYTAWGRFGMPSGIVLWSQGRGGQGYTTRPGVVFDIYKSCEEGKYIDQWKPWLFFDQDADSITIYSVHDKKLSKSQLLDIYISTVPKRELVNYANRHSLSVNVLSGKRPFETGKKKTAELVVLQGKHSDFIKAGWETELQEDLHKKEQAVLASRNGSVATRERVIASMPMIKCAYNSEAMDAVEAYMPMDYGRVLCSSRWDYTLYSHGVNWHKLDGSIIDGSWFMQFQEIGYENLATDEQLFSFAVAMFCRKNKIEPANLDVKRIAWNCEIKSNHIGKYINNPSLIPDAEPPIQLKSIF